MSESAADLWTEPIAAFAESLRGRVSTATIEGYCKHLGWLAASATVGPFELKSTELAAWLDSRQWSFQTRRKVLVSFRRFYAWAVSEARCEWAPTAGISTSAPNKRGPKAAEPPAAWAEPIAGFVAWSRAGRRAESTIQQRCWWLVRLAEVAADPWAVTNQQLATWLSTPDWAAETKRVARATVRRFYAWGVKAGHVAASPAEDLDSVLISRTLPRPAPDEAVAAALRGADDRTRIAIMLAALAGLRRAEIAAIHTQHIGATDLLVLSGKGGHQRRVPLHPDLREALEAEMARRRLGKCGTGFAGRSDSGKFVSATGYLFPSDEHPGPITAHHIGKLIARALPEPYTAHTLRHRFATAAYGFQRDLRAVQELLGHSKPETTARYAAVPDGALTTAVAGVSLPR